MSEPSVTYSIVNWNRRDLLRDCVASIRRHAGSQPYEIIVVDNASTDGSREMVRDEFPDVRLIENAENLGYGRAHNQAMRSARGRFILLLNNDVLLLPGTVEHLVGFLEHHPEVGAAGGRLYTDTGRSATQPSAFRRYPTPWNDLLDRGLGGRLRRWWPGSRLTRAATERWSRTCPEDGEPQWAAHLVGAAIMTRREVVDQGLLFDESFDFFFEETDWCRRLHARGWRIAYVPSAALIHLYSRSFAQRADREAVHYRSYLRYLRKHEGWLAVGLARLLHGLTRRAAWWKVLGVLIVAYSAAHFLVAGLIHPIRQAGIGGDFRAAFHHSYRFNPQLGRSWLYGPVVHWLMYPLSSLQTDQQIGLVMLAVNYAFLIAAVALLCRVVLPPPWRWGEAVTLAAVWLNFYPLYEAIGERNIEIVELLGLVLALWALWRARERLAGIAIGVATMTKFLPVVLVPYFWLTGRKKAFWWSLGTIAAIALLTQATIGFQHSETFRYVRAYDYDTAFWNNQALSGIVARLLRAGARMGRSPWSVAEVTVVGRWIALILSGLLMAALGWLMRRPRGGRAVDLECSMLAIAMVLVPLHARSHYLSFLLIGLTVGLAHAWRAHPPVPRWWVRALVLAFFLSGLVMPLSAIDHLIGQPGFSFARALQEYSVPGWGALLLLWLLAHRYRRIASASPFASEAASAQTILIASHEFPPIVGGAGRFAESIAAGLAGRGLRVMVLTPQHPVGADHPPYERRFVSVPHPTALAYLAWCWHLIRMTAQEPSAVILATDILTQRACALLPKRLRRRCAILAHGSEVLANFAERWPKRPLYTRLYRDVPIIVANSRYTQQLLTCRGVEARKIHVIHPWLDPLWWEQAPDPSRVLNQFGLSAARVILTVGRLSRRKRQDAVIRALPRVLQRVPDATYVMVGSGEQESYLRSLARQCGVADRVIFAGSVPREELMHYYDACSLFVMPSQRAGSLVEGFGIAFLEAQARGKPVVAGRESGADEAIQDGSTGRLIDPDATEELAETMSTLLTDRSLADAMGQAGRRNVSEHSTSGSVDRLCALLASGGRLTSAWKAALPADTDPFQLTETAYLARYNHWIMDTIRPFVGQSVMEIGAGIGNLSSQLVDRRRLVVTDMAETYLRTLRARFAAYPHLEVRRFALHEPVPSDLASAFDTVICVNVLEHVEADREALATLRSLLRPGGHLLLFVPAFQWLFGPIDTALGHYRRYHRRPLMALLQEGGFEVARCGYFNLIGVAGWFVNSRILRRAELPPWQFRCYDALVPWFRRVERLTGTPIGQSLIAVARRPMNPRGGLDAV